MSGQPTVPPPAAAGAPTEPAQPSQHETPRPPSHNGSTSSSNANTPRSTSVEPGPTLWVEMWENQRWFPVIGWSTSRFQQDLPTFCRVPPGHRSCGSHPADFDAALNATNPPRANAANPHFPAQSILHLRVPQGYRWVGYWEICKEHRHGTDVGGWRYAEQFFVPDQNGGYRNDTIAPFKKTQTSLCVVRRRLWRRRVAVLTRDEVAPSYNEDLYMTDDDMQTQAYLSDMEEEMHVAEGFKDAEAAAARSGTPWTREQELKAEEELRKFCRQRRSRESATRMRSANPSFANPFQHNTDGYHISPTQHDASTAEKATPATTPNAEAAHSGAAAAASWVRDSQPEPSPQNASPSEDSNILEHHHHHHHNPNNNNDGTGDGNSSSNNNGNGGAPQEEEFLFRATSMNTPSRVDGGDVSPESRVNRFVAASPTELPGLQPDAGDLQAQTTLDGFVVSTPVDEVDHTTTDDDGATVSVGGMKSPTGAEFRAIFSQFMTPSAAAADKTEGANE